MKSSLLALALVICLLGTATVQAENSFDSDGTRIYFAEAGKGQAVVLLHGFIGSSDEWQSPPPFLSEQEQESFRSAFSVLSRSYRVIAPDSRGHGRSGKPPDVDAYGTAMAGDVVNLLDHLAVDRAHIVGYSMGAFVAAKLAVMHPDRVNSLVLGGTGAVLEGSEQLAFMTAMGESLAAGRGVEPLIKAMMPAGAPAPTPEQIEQSNRMFLTNQNEKALAGVALGHTQLTVSEKELEELDVPALLIVGGNDPQKAAAEKTHALLPDSDLVVLDGFDHISTQISPAFAKHVQKFIQQHSGKAYGRNRRAGS